jgi:hypothetical protein
MISSQNPLGGKESRMRGGAKIAVNADSTVNGKTLRERDEVSSFVQRPAIQQLFDTRLCLLCIALIDGLGAWPGNRSARAKDCCSRVLAPALHPNRQPEIHDAARMPLVKGP